MVMQGETISTGAPDVCPNCGKKVKLEIVMSPAGFYIGTMCKCGPYSRESGYYKTRELAELALLTNFYHR